MALFRKGDLPSPLPAWLSVAILECWRISAGALFIPALFKLVFEFDLLRTLKGGFESPLIKFLIV